MMGMAIAKTRYRETGRSNDKNAINRVHFFVQRRLLLGEKITRDISSKNSLRWERAAFELVLK